VIVVIRLCNQQSNNFRKEQQQNAKWSGLARYLCSFPAFPVGSPSKGVNYTPSELRGQYPQEGLWLLTCTLPTSSSSSELLAKESGLGGSDMEESRERLAWLILRVLKSTIFLVVV